MGPTSASRAHAMAVRFAADPPDTSTPAASDGYPIHSRNQSRTVSSSWLRPAASRHAPASLFAAATIFAALHRFPSTSAVVLKDGSNLSVHLAPSPVVVRVATFTGHIRVDPLPWLEREVALATYLASIGASVMAPSDLVPVGPHVIDGWALTAWRYVEHVPGLVPETSASFAALDELHEAMRGF